MAAPESLFTPEPIEPRDLRGRKVTVMGLGLFGGGRGLAEFLCRAGARVTVTDLRNAEALRPSLESLEKYSIRWVLGKHREEDFLQAELVFVNPAIPRDSHLLARCRQKGIPLETEMNLFFKLCRGKICGITGSNGKTTTTCLTGDIFRSTFPGTRVGGNLGVSLLNDLDSITPEDWVVLELSSFQLEDLKALSRRPEISLVTNVSPNHLNRHESYRNYLEAKRTILEGNSPETWAVLNGDDAVVRGWSVRTKRSVIYFGSAGAVLPRARGVWLAGDAALLSEGPRRERLFSRKDLSLPGRFNALNAAGAAAAGLAAGCAPETIREAVRSFLPLEHRLEFVRRLDGVEYYNDSIATTPESTLCAIEAFGPDLVLIAGGSSKGESFGRLGLAIARRTGGAILIGETAQELLKAVRTVPGSVPAVQASSLEEAVAQARKLARPGFRVALSPACASYDMFTNFGERGRRFKEIVRELAPQE